MLLQFILNLAFYLGVVGVFVIVVVLLTLLWEKLDNVVWDFILRCLD